MKVFNKDKAEHNLKLKQNKNKYIKYTTIGLSCLILVIGIIMFTFAYLETKEEFTIINGTVGAVKKDVVLNANGGTLTNNTIRLTLGEVISNLPIPTRHGYELEGWYLDSELTQKVTNETLMNKNITNIYAKWNKYPIIVSGDLNTVGSVVRIANEEFYVIGQQDSSHVKLFSKWNLNVGNNTQPGEQGIQNSKAIGWNSDSSTRVNYYYPATVAFSSTNYWLDSNWNLKPTYGSNYPAYVYDSNSNLKQYVDNYVTYLNNQGVQVSGRLISYEELESLGCNGESNMCQGAPSWVSQTSYWTGSAFGEDRLWIVLSDNIDIENYSRGKDYGVRPVIILEK